jgi:hypothetical protein
VPHHLVVTATGAAGGATVTAYLDTNLVGSITTQAGATYDTFCVGGAYGGGGSHFGSIQIASIYPYVLAPYQIVNHCAMGQYGNWEMTTDDAIAVLAAVGGVPVFWNATGANHQGLSMTDYLDITGSNALANMQLFEQTEQGLLYVNAAGELSFCTRDWKMGYPAPDLYLPPDTFDSEMGYEVIDTYLVNEASVSTSTIVGASWVNGNSQNEYGVYATNAIGSPLQLPMISWARGYANLGLPPLTYWPDPNTADLAQWQANHFSEPQLTPGQLVIDTLSLTDANTARYNADGIGISDLYGLEIGNMIAPSGDLPASFPNQTGAMEWFIEGISETISQSARTWSVYTSPASQQRCWRPGDPVYGILGVTSMIGLSEADTSVPQADGKDCSHDGGPPYWAPAAALAAPTTMNNPANNGHYFIGSRDIRGLHDTVGLMLQPPMLVVGAVQNQQVMSAGDTANPELTWDTIYVDTEGGMGAWPGWPNWYVCLVAGFYDIDVSVIWNNAAATGVCQGWVIVAANAAQGLANGTGTPLTADQYVSPVGESSQFNSYSVNNANCGSMRLYLGLGDMVTVGAQQTTTAGGTKNLGTDFGGSRMSLLFRGYSTMDDRVQINSSILSGGVVSSKVQKLAGSYSMQNTSTYSYRGNDGTSDDTGLQNTNSYCYQGIYLGTAYGSMTSQIVFDFAAMRDELTSLGATVTSVTVAATNVNSIESSCTMLLGWSGWTPGGSTYNPIQPVDHPNLLHQSFRKGTTPTVTMTLPISFWKGLVTGGATMLIIGWPDDVNSQYAASWNGGPGWWAMTVYYTY